MSKLYTSIAMLYKHKMISLDGLKKAVADGNVTAEEYKKISGKDYVA